LCSRLPEKLPVRNSKRQFQPRFSVAPFLYSGSGTAFGLRHRGGASRCCFVQSAKPSVHPTCAPGRVLDVRLYRYGKRQFASSTRQSLSPRRSRAGCLSVGMSDLLASRLSLADCRQRLRKRHPPGYCRAPGASPLGAETKARSRWVFCRMFCTSAALDDADLPRQDRPPSPRACRIYHPAMDLRGHLVARPAE